MTETIKIEKVLSREIFEAAQATQLLKKLCKGSGVPVHIHFMVSGDWIVYVNGYSFRGETLLAALEMANPFLESLRK